MTGRQRHLARLKDKGFCHVCGMTRSRQGGVADYHYGNPDAHECSDDRYFVAIESFPDDPMKSLSKKMGHLVVFMAIVLALTATGRFLHELERSVGERDYGEAIYGYAVK